MTGGVAVILGRTGRNFGAGMSGGMAYVLDEQADFEHRYNDGMVGLERVSTDIDEQLLKTMIERHHTLTGSVKAKALLDDWQAALATFWKVAPHPALEDASAEEQDMRSLENAALQAILAEADTPSPANA
jgi:glutamate synthase domain-containing protein 3